MICSIASGCASGWLKLRSVASVTKPLRWIWSAQPKSWSGRGCESRKRYKGTWNFKRWGLFLTPQPYHPVQSHSSKSTAIHHVRRDWESAQCYGFPVLSSKFSMNRDFHIGKICSSSFGRWLPFHRKLSIVRCCFSFSDTRPFGQSRFNILA